MYYVKRCAGEWKGNKGKSRSVNGQEKRGKRSGLKKGKKETRRGRKEGRRGQGVIEKAGYE